MRKNLILVLWQPLELREVANIHYYNTDNIIHINTVGETDLDEYQASKIRR